jgi:hypothetical protein
MEGSKMKKTLLLSGILSLVVAIALFAGCAFEQPASDEEAIVEVTIVQDMFSTKTIEPNEPMDIAEYELIWWETGSSTENTKTVTPANGTTTVYLLLSPGIEYNFKIEGYNSYTDNDTVKKDKIGESAVETSTFYPGSSMTITLEVIPIAAVGDFAVTVDWTAVDLTDLPDFDARVEATIEKLLYDEDTGVYSYDSPINPSFIGDPAAGVQSTVINGTAIDNGYYKCTIQMIDETDPDPDKQPVIWTTVDALRIVAGYISVETYTLNRQLDAFITVKAEENLKNTLFIDFTVKTVTSDSEGNPVVTGPVPYTDPDESVPDNYLPPYFVIPLDANGKIVVWAYPRDRGTRNSTDVDIFEWSLDAGASLTAVSGESLTITSKSGVSIEANDFTIPDFHTITVMIYKNGSLSSRSVNFIVE